MRLFKTLLGLIIKINKFKRFFILWGILQITILIISLIYKVREIIIPSLILPIILLWIDFIGSYRPRKALDKLSKYLSGSISNDPFENIFNGEYIGFNFSVTLCVAVSDADLSYLAISLNFNAITNLFFKLKIFKNSWRSLVIYLAQLGIVRKIKINDEIFDREFLIFSNNSSNKLLNYLNEERKNTIKELFDMGFDTLLIDDKNITVKKSRYRLNLDLEPQRIINIIQK